MTENVTQLTRCEIQEATQNFVQVMRGNIFGKTEEGPAAPRAN